MTGHKFLPSEALSAGIPPIKHLDDRFETISLACRKLRLAPHQHLLESFRAPSAYLPIKDKTSMSLGFNSQRYDQSDPETEQLLARPAFLYQEEIESLKVNQNAYLMMIPARRCHSKKLNHDIIYV